MGRDLGGYLWILPTTHLKLGQSESLRIPVLAITRLYFYGHLPTQHTHIVTSERWSECGNLNLAALYAFVLDLEGVELATTAEFERLSHHWRFLILILYWLENNSSCTFVTTYIRGLVQVRQKKLLSYWQQNPHEDLVVKLQASWKAMEMIIMELLLCKWLYFWSLSN